METEKSIKILLETLKSYWAHNLLVKFCEQTNFVQTLG